MLGMTPGEMWVGRYGRERERGLVVPPPLRILDSSLDLCNNFFADKYFSKKTRKSDANSNK